MKTLQPEYIVDASGRKVKIILPVEEYERLLANLPEEQVGRRESELLKLDWRGALAELRGEYDAVSLQHEAASWREN